MDFKDIVNKKYLGDRHDITITSPPRNMDEEITIMKKIEDSYGKLCPHCGCTDLFIHYYTDFGLEDGWKFWKPVKRYLYGTFTCQKCLMMWKSPLVEYERFEDCKENK